MSDKDQTVPLFMDCQSLCMNLSIYRLLKNSLTFGLNVLTFGLNLFLENH